MEAARSPSIVLVRDTPYEHGERGTGRAGGPRGPGQMGAGGAGAFQSLCGEDSAHELLPAHGNHDGLWSTWVHRMAEMVRKW